MHTLSRYVANSTQSDLENMGCTLGNRVESMGGTQRPVVVLDFASQYYSSTNGWMFSRWGGSNVTDNWARDAVKSYGAGFWRCSGADVSSVLTVALGTNNDGTVTSDAGRALANRVDEAENYAANNFGGQVQVVGADDFEQSFSGPGVARNWMDGYDGANSNPVYNYGSADGCPPAGTCNGGWDASDYWYVSWHGPAWPLPEIYNENGVNADQWKRLSLWSYNNKGSAYAFIASLTQHDACTQNGGCSGTNNTADDGWTQLHDALTSNANTAAGAGGLKATDIGWY